MLSILFFQFSTTVMSGPGGGAGTGGPGTLPPGTGGGHEMRIIDGTDYYSVDYHNPGMPAVNLDDYISNQFEFRDRFTDDQFEMINELINSGAFEKLEFQFRDGSRMMIGQ